MIILLLTKPQHAVFGWLREYGGLRDSHIIALLQMKFHDEKLRVSPIINELNKMRLIRREGEIYTADGCHAEPNLLTAMDIMLELSPENIQTVRRGEAPFLITFFKEKSDKLFRYDVVAISPGSELIINAQFEGINHKYRTIVCLLENIEQQKSIRIACEHCFAVVEDGAPKFYKYNPKG